MTISRHGGTVTTLTNFLESKNRNLLSSSCDSSDRVWGPVGLFAHFVARSTTKGAPAGCVSLDMGPGVSIALPACGLLLAMGGAARGQPTMCGHGRTALEAVEQAAAVARVEIVAIQPTQLEVLVIDQLRGTTPVILRGSSACRHRVKVGDTAIVMTTSGGYLDHGSENIVANADPRIDVVLALAETTTPGERAEVITWTIAHHSAADAEAAALYLAGSPATLAAIERHHRSVLRREAARHPTRELALALARLRIRYTPKIYERLGLAGSLAQQIAGIRDFEKIDDSAVLVGIIAKETDPARRFAAIERCDRVRKLGSAIVTATQLSARSAGSTRILEMKCFAPAPRPRVIARPSPRPPPPPPSATPGPTPPLPSPGSPSGGDLIDPFAGKPRVPAARPAKPKRPTKPTPPPPAIKRNPYDVLLER
jgi:hypothetical protein